MRGVSRVDAMLLGTVLIWAFNVTVTKYVLTHGFQPLAYGSIRYGGAVILSGVIAYGLEGSFRIGERRSLVRLAAASAILLGNQVAFVYALKLASGTTVALILGTTPIFTALVSFVVGLERPTARLWAAAFVTFAGVALVALGSGGDVTAHLGGDLCAIGLAFSWACYSVTLTPLMRSYSPYRVSAVVLAAMSIPLLAISSPQIAHQNYGFHWLVWLCLGFAIVGPLVLTNILWFKAIDRVGPSRATVVANLQPFLAAIFAWLILSEHIGGLQFAGGGLILAGVLLERARRRRPVPMSVD